jgi:hypothetical protein
MTETAGALEPNFQELSKRSDVVFHELRRIVDSPTPDLKAMASLTSEAETIAAKMASIVRAKRASTRQRDAFLRSE